MVQPPAIDEHQPDLVGPAALLSAAEAGEEWALARLHADHDAPLRRYLRAHAGGGEERLAARAWIAASGRFAEVPDSGRGFRSWLLRIAREEVARDRRSPRWGDDGATARLLARVEVRAGGPAAFAAESLAGDAATARITEALSKDQSEVVVLAVVGRCTVDEIALVTGRPRREVRAVQDEAGIRLEQIFGATELFRHIQRAGRTVATEPPPGLLPAMAEAAHRSRKRLRPTTALAAKVAIVGTVLVGTATGAAATGALPDAAAQVIATIATQVGLDLPQPAEGPATGETDQELPTVDAPPTDGPSTERPPADGPSAESLPTDGPSTETNGADVSDVARDTEATGADKGKQIADSARDGNGRDVPARPEDGGSPSSTQPPHPPAAEPAPQGSAPPDPSSSTGGGGAAPAGGPGNGARGGR